MMAGLLLFELSAASAREAGTVAHGALPAAIANAVVVGAWRKSFGTAAEMRQALELIPGRALQSRSYAGRLHYVVVP